MELEKFIHPSLLADNSDSTEVRSYMKKLSTEEMTVLSSQIVVQITELDELEDEERERKKQYAESVKARKTQLKADVLAARYKQREQSGLVYKMVDQESKLTSFYGEDGFLIETRPMLPQEAQLTLKRVING